MLNTLKKILRPSATVEAGQPIGKRQCGVVKGYDQNCQMKLVYYQCTYAATGNNAAVVARYNLVASVASLANRIAEGVICEAIGTLDAAHATELPEGFTDAIIAKLNAELATFGLKVAAHDISL